MAKEPIRLITPDFVEAELLSFESAIKKKESRRDDYAQTIGQKMVNGWTLDETFALESILNELNQRESEALALFTPVPGAVELRTCLAGEIGMVGANRAGKSLAVGERMARIITGQWPIPDMFPSRDGEAAIVGPNLDHVRLLYHTLFKPGQFRVLKTDTGWKVPSYECPEDVERIKEWSPAPPLVPPRMVAKIAWEDSKKEIPSLITLVNGWTLHFFSFESDAPRGVFWHIAWLDEESRRLQYWLSEVRARLMSRKGYLVMSATEESATPTLHRMQSRAKRPDMATKPPYEQTKFFKLYSRDNPYLDPSARKAFAERLHEDDPEAAMVKVEGESSFTKYLVYQEFDENKHVIEPFEIEWRDTVYVIVDPSRTRLAMLLLVLVHPDSKNFVPEQPDRIVAFDEIVLKGATAYDAAKALANKLNDQYKHWIESMVIDWQQGRKKDDSEKQIAEYYWDAMEDAGIKPRVAHWIHGSSNLEGGIETVAQFLKPNNDLPPKFVCMRGKTQELVWEFLRYYRIKNPDGSPGKPFQRNNDLVDCARYACQADLVWVSPPGSLQTAKHYSAEELKAIDRNPRMWLYKAMYGEPPTRRRRL